MATQDENRVVLITGASSGIGYHCALHLHQLGYRVYGTSRRVGQNHDGKRDEGRFPFPLIQMDVNNDSSVEAGVNWLMREQSRLDVVVNNAGYGLAGSVEDTSSEEAKQQFETNFFGVLSVCRVAIPIMRRQRHGHIINIGSIAGSLGIPFQGVYSASKFALEGLSEALRMEVEPFGIHVVLLSPGNYRTEFTASRLTATNSDGKSVYREAFRRALGVMEKDELNAPEPVEVARVLEKAITVKRPRMRYVVDPTIARHAPTMKRLLPYPLVEYALKRVFKLR